VYPSFTTEPAVDCVHTGKMWIVVRIVIRMLPVQTSADPQVHMSVLRYFIPDWFTDNIHSSKKHLFMLYNDIMAENGATLP